jgi:hypothetical protein
MVDILRGEERGGQNAASLIHSGILGRNVRYWRKADSKGGLAILTIRQWGDPSACPEMPQLTHFPASTFGQHPPAESHRIFAFARRPVRIKQS